MALEFNLDSKLGTDDFPPQKIFYLILMSIFVFILAFYTVNVSGAFQEALIYWVLLISGISIFAISKIIATKKGIDFPNPITWERKTIFGELSMKTYLIIFAVFFFIGMYLFFRIGQSTTYQVINAPTFQLIEMTPGIRSSLSAIAGFVEDFTLFGVIPVLVFGLIFAITKNPAVALLLTLFIAPAVFMEYHVGRYGAEMPVKMAAVYSFGFFAVAVTLIFRNVLLVSIIHAFNNYGVTFFSMYKIVNSMWYFYAIVIIAAIIFGYAYYRLKIKK